MDKNKLESLIKGRGIRLDLSCGSNKQPHWIGLDIRDLHSVDLL